MDRLRTHLVLSISVAAMLGLVLFVPATWNQVVEGNSRNGQGWLMPRAERGLWLAGLGLVMYLLPGIGMPRHWAMRPPTDGEVSVARWLMRAAGLLAIWVAFYVTLPA
jgi:hypothetical protein